MFCLIGLLMNAKASHISGGKIWYEYLGNNTYKIHCALYRDCSGIPLLTSLAVEITSVSSGLLMSASLNQTSVSIAVPFCVSSLLQSSCNGGPLWSVQEYLYEGVVFIPVNVNDIVIATEDCCRSNSITNIVQGGFGSYYSVTLDNLNNTNNSSKPVNSVQLIIPINQTTNIDLHHIDPDGDSLVYFLDTARTSQGAPIFYNSGFSPSQPITSSPACSLNSSTGIFTVTPVNNEIDVLAYNVLEYRNGVLICTSHIDELIYCVPGTGNQIPTLSGINNTTNFTTSVSAGQTLSFNVNSFDPDVADSTYIRFDSTVNASMSLSPAAQTVGTFTWTPNAADVRPYPYVISFTVFDNACPYRGNQSYAYQIYVNQANTDTVWPGDANADYSDDLYDILSLGVAFGSTGPTRPAANITWTAQPCPNWIDTFPSGVNFKHADTNGDGLVDINDTLAVINNLGSTHMRMGGSESTTGLKLYCNMPVSDYGFTTQSIPIELSNDASGIDSVYGLSFRLSWPMDTITLSSTSLSTTFCLFDAGNQNHLVVQHDQSGNAYIDIAMVNKNHISSIPYGTVSVFNFQPNYSGSATNTPLTPHLSNIHAIDKFGNDLPIEGIDSTEITIWEGVENINSIMNVQLFPNPASSSFTLQADVIGLNNVVVQVQDICGRNLVTKSSSAFELKNGIQFSSSELPSGIYHISITENGSWLYSKSLVIQ